MCGALKQAFTEVLSTVVGNLISVSLVLVAMFVLSWEITLISLALLPVFLFPARLSRASSAEDRAREVQPECRDEQHHGGALQRGRCSIW